jgi:restriction system protein
MLFSNAGFQKGAHDFANNHGIALISVIEGRFTYKTRSQDSPNFDPPPWADIPKYVGEYQYDFENRHMISYLQEGYMDALSDFIFDKSK